MKGVFLSASALALAAVLALSGCNGNKTNPSPGPTATPTISNISGDYSGTLSDAQLGSGSADGTLAQHGSSAGGTMSVAASQPFDASVSLVINASNALSGGIVINGSSGTCTFSTTGSYDPNSNVITGTYTAVSGCSGDTGTYSLTQQCFDTVTSVGRRPMTLTKC